MGGGAWFKADSAIHLEGNLVARARDPVEGIVGLWENVEENQPLIGCLIISLTHSLLIEMRAILTLTRLFIASLTLRLPNTEQCIHKYNTNYIIEKYMHRKITQCKLHASIRPYVHNKYFNWLAPIPEQEFIKELGT